MELKQNFLPGSNAFIKVSLVSLFVITTMILKAQTPANFSGKWEFDKARSDKEETGDASFEGIIILEINQGSSAITFINTFIPQGKKGVVLPPDSYFLDGRVTTDNGGTGPAKKFLKWSQDKKILTTSLIMTDTVDGVSQDFLTANTYKLSDDRKTLVVEELHKSKLNGEKTIKKVYRKKI